MRLPVTHILRHQRDIIKNQKIFRIMFLGGTGEVARACRVICCKRILIYVFCCRMRADWRGADSESFDGYKNNPCHEFL